MTKRKKKGLAQQVEDAVREGKTGVPNGHVPVDSIKIDKHLAAMLPEPPNIDGLRESIRDKGILVPLLVTSDGLLLDGHRRLVIAKELGITSVPVEQIGLRGTHWHESVVRAVNRDRRELPVAWRIQLATTHLRIEREAAEARQKAGKPSPSGTGKVTDRHGCEATARAARLVGISRKTLERGLAILNEAPSDVREAFLAGKKSVAGAYSAVKQKRNRERFRKTKPDKTTYLHFADIPKAKYRCIYADPPWKYQWGGERGHVDQHYASLGMDDLQSLDVASLAHPDGAHLWLWTTWPKIRDRAPHRLLESWGFDWIGEIVWHKKRLATGYWLRPTTEVLILAHRGKLPLLARDQAGFFEQAPEDHSAKPNALRKAIERLTPGPRIELFARRVPVSWAAWGNQVERPNAE